MNRLIANLSKIDRSQKLLKENIFMKRGRMLRNQYQSALNKVEDKYEALSIFENNFP